jgi:hypothetical protein
LTADRRASRITLSTMYAPDSRPWLRPAFAVDEEAPCGTSVAEAREALAFWRARLRRLPWYRRAARAEAREMIVRWRGRMLQASLERWRLGALTGPVLALGAWWGPTRWTAVRRASGRLLRTSPVARMIAAAALTVTLAAFAVLALAIVALAQLT